MEKELKRLSRLELIDIIYEQQKQLDAANETVQKLQKQLEQREVTVANAGSIAEAVLQLNGVFEAAQAAADQYLASVKAATADSEAMVNEAKRRQQEILDAAQKQSSEILLQAQNRGASLVEEAERQAEGKWIQFEKRVDDVIAANRELQSIISRGN